MMKEAKDMTKAELLAEIVMLDTYLRGRAAGDIDVETSAAHRDGATLSINASTGKCELWSWMESGHNGDPYDNQQEVLAGVVEREHLERAHLYLFAKVRKEVVRRANKEQEEAARLALDKRVRTLVFGAQ